MSKDYKNQPVRIFRSPHDTDHKYTKIANALLWDSSVSFKARGLLCYLLSLFDNWEVNPKQIAKSQKIGEDQVYSALKELIKAGYCKRECQRNEKGRAIFWTYEISEEKRFQVQSEPLRDFPDLDVPDLDNGDTTNNCPLPITKETKDLCPDSIESRSSPIGLELATLLFESIKKTKPDIKPPNLKAWEKELDRMTRLDQRDLERIKAVINWLPSSDFWKKVILSAEKFRKQFDRLEIEMDNGREDSWIKENKTLVQKLKDENPISLKHIIIRKNSVVNTENSKDMSLKINPKQFFDLFVHITGRKYRG